MIEQYKHGGSVDINRLIENFTDDEIISLATEIASRDWENNNIAEKTNRAIKAIMEQNKKRLRMKLFKEMAEAEKSGNHEEADMILKKIRSLGLDAG